MNNLIELDSIEVFHLRMTLKNKFITSFGDETIRHPIIIKIRSNDIEGYGEAPGDTSPLYSYETYKTIMYALKTFLIPLVLKRRAFSDPLDFHKALQVIRGHKFAKTALEYAFYDLYAKFLRKPLFELYGGTKKRIPVGVSVGIMSDLRKLIKSIEEYLNRGYRRIKLKIKPSYDIEVIKRIRDTFGDIPLQVDANASYTLKDHLNTLIELDKLNLIMIEQPLHYEDLVDHSYLRSKINTPICLDESITSHHLAKAAIALGSLDVINVKPPRVGGIIESLKILDLARRSNIGAWIGGMLETGIGKLHLLHLATRPEINYHSDISESSRYWSEDIIEPPLLLNSDGTITVPNKPGLGVEVDFDRLTKFLRHHWVFR